MVWSQLNGSDRPYTVKDRKHVPSSTFLATPYSRVGLNEREAKAAGLDYVVKRLPVAAVPKAQVMRRPDGLMKAIVERNTGRILGAMLLSVESHEVINIVKLAMDLRAGQHVARYGVHASDDCRGTERLVRVVCSHSTPAQHDPRSAARNRLP